MASRNRILIGKRATGGYGLYVSKADSDVLTCDQDELLFDSREYRGTGQVYAGGGPLNITSGSGQNFLTTGSKDNLGYIPLVICNEDYAGHYMASFTGDGVSNEEFQSRVDAIKTTSTTITPIYLNYSTGTYVYEDRRSSAEAHYGGDQACTNLHFTVLKIPCAYGYMNGTYF